LSQSHVIPRAELMALAQTNPDTRGQRVRVVQGLQGSQEPPDAPHVDVGAQVNVVVVQPISGPRHAHPAAPTQSAKSSKDDAKFWLVVAAMAAVVVAATEGMRYDGWVELHPMHPVHLYGWDGTYTWMPLAQITPETAAGARKAVVRESEGPWRTLGRAPLSRRGWTYSMLMGSSETPLPGQPGVRGFASHVQLGRFMTPHFGVLLDFGVGWGETDVGAAIYDSRHALELQYLPLDAGILHGGLFGQVGMGYRLDDGAGPDRGDFLLGGGAIAQLELTTRLAITARVAQTMVYGTRTSDLTVGLSIY
jgi:hypothetical protein